MAVVRKVQSRVKIVKKQETSASSERPTSTEPLNTNIEPQSLEKPKKKVCPFCEGKSLPHYWDSQALRRFTNDHGRITSRQRSGVCSKHQRMVSQEIKRARHLALLPFVVSI